MSFFLTRNHLFATHYLTKRKFLLTSLDVMIVALFICGTRAVILPKRRFYLLQFGIFPIITAISALLVHHSILVLVGATVLKRRADPRTG